MVVKSIKGKFMLIELAKDISLEEATTIPYPLIEIYHTFNEPEGNSFLHFDPLKHELLAEVGGGTNVCLNLLMQNEKPIVNNLEVLIDDSEGLYFFCVDHFLLEMQYALIITSKVCSIQIENQLFKLYPNRIYELRMECNNHFYAMKGRYEGYDNH
jgi:hypothetical protein